MNDYLEPTQNVPHNENMWLCVETAMNMKLYNTNDILYDKLNKVIYNILNVNTKPIKAKYTRMEVLHMHQNMTNITFKTIITNVLVLGFNYAIEKPTKLYIQELIIDTGNGTRHVDN